MIALNDLLRIAQIKKRTFRFYKEKGVIQADAVVKGLGGKGTVSYYPNYVLRDLILIKRLKKEGKTLDEIKKFLHEGEYRGEKKFQKIVNPDKFKTWESIYREVKKAFPNQMVTDLDTEIHKQGDSEVMITARIQFCPHKKTKKEK